MKECSILELVFKDAEDKNIVFWFDDADASVTTAQIKALMNTIIENGDVFNHVPVKSESADIISIAVSHDDLT